VPPVFVLITAAAAGLAGPPGALDDSDSRRIHTFSPSPDCREWESSRRISRPRSNPNEAWVLGLFAGHNLYHPRGHTDILEGTTAAEAFAWIDRRCAQNPDAAVADLALELISELETRAGF